MSFSRTLSLSAALIATAIFVHAELPSKGFRAVEGGASPDGRWVVSVLDSSGVEFIDELPEEHHSPYLVDLGKLAAVSKIPQADTLGGYHGRPETNVTAKWFPDSKAVAIRWRVARMSYDFLIFAVSATGGLQEVKLPAPGEEGTIFARLKPHSNAGRYMESVTGNGEVVVVYYGYHPKDSESWDAEAAKGFDHNRIEVVYGKDGEEWKVRSIASPGVHGPSNP